MAKTTKKSESTEKKPAARKSPAKQAPAKKPAAPGDSPMIDTNLAAQAAARMVVSQSDQDDGRADPHKNESSTFKHMKQQLAKPKSTGLANLLGPAGAKKKAGPQFNLNQQRGHNQTFGGTNTGVPRRTNG